MSKIKEITAKKLDFNLQENQKNIAIVVSRFNQEITDTLLTKALERLKTLEFPEPYITIVKVPGAIEIGLTAQKLAISGNYSAIICLGAVIRGETDHYQSVCQQVSYACQKIALQALIPVIFAVLMTNDEKQAQERCSKGGDAVDTAMEMISVLNQMDSIKA